jgi:diguanylate cyclase (GGDEF)-like protein
VPYPEGSISCDRGPELTGRIWKAWLFPGALLLGLSAAIVNSSLFSLFAPSLGFYYAGVFAAGLLLSWRFNSSRILFSLIVLVLGHRAIGFFSAGQNSLGAGHMAVVLVALLIPLNFIVFASIRERGLLVAGIGPRFLLLFVESVFVAVLCRPDTIPSAGGAWSVPPWAFFSLIAGVGVFILRYYQTRKPIEPGFVWSLGAVFLWLQSGPLGEKADAYVATAGLILTASLIETSYMLAYHDELTGIRGRRAFNDALLSLDQQYAIGIVDIDHFKKFNDTYGHDIGDQVLCLVAARLSEVKGGGQAFRCGGEEFALLFRNTSAKEAFEHLDLLRQAIQNSTFRMRGTDRRREPRAGDPDRRKPARQKASQAAAPDPAGLSVTVSIGVAEPSTRDRQPEQVINAADQALYLAKRNGRNRVELAGASAARVAKKNRAGGVRS